jgi:hypothetical protein
VAFLHYGPDLRIRLDDPATKLTMEAIGSHATRGGWVTVADNDGREWSFLVSAGIPIWVSENE